MGVAGTDEAAVAAAPKLQFRILGPLEVWRDGAVVDVGARKQRAVLALLLLNANRVVPTERLIDELWGDTPPETARSALQVYVAALRKALGGEGSALRTSAPGYVLDVEPGALDLDRFIALRAEAQAAGDEERRSELLREALELWRDTPLADLSTEPFAATAVARLEEQRLEVLEQRIDADLALGRHASLVPELEALVAEQPYRERLRAQLMLALYRSGRQADALRAYQTARRTLGDELGLEPGPELRELEAAILRHDARLSLDGSVESAAEEPAQHFSSRRALMVAAVVLVVAAASAALLLSDGPTPLTVPPGSVAAIDPAENQVVAVLSVGSRPGPIAYGAGSLWVGNLEGRTLTRIDPRRQADPQYDRAAGDADRNRRRLRRRLGSPRTKRTAFPGRSGLRTGDDDRRPRRTSGLSADRRRRGRRRACLGRLREVDPRPRPAGKCAAVGFDTDRCRCR